ncbi:GNAT family N-acetyltransferase [uncultured Modestobacter sp.]|uniref:GNAT family N-acetyltransferase n=1 Tax=uncultured Modestobacter sp. TaxID=380048 RepID=UPI00261BD4CC|nr:GNAT family N-acetyltransferase [uncultured Modestobacter sp.]
MPPASAVVRPYRPADRAAVYDVCVRTADAGGDARGRWSTDDLMPDLFAGPYVDLEPERAFVLDDGERVVGYVLGTADTAGFVTAWRTRWLPRLAGRYPEPPDPPRTSEEAMVALLHRPERMLVPELAAHPAHLHVDLLPPAQGAGWGRALIDTFRAAVAAAGAPGVHLGIDPANTRALGFYARLGFTEIAVPGATGVVYLGRPTA